MTTIAELAEDRTVEGVFAVTKKERKRTRAGAAYLALELADARGRVEARVWNDVDLLDGRFEEGDAVHVLGRVERFGGRLQVQVRAVEAAEDADPASLTPTLRRDADELDGFFIHVDADCLDDAIMPAVDYRLPGGLAWHELEMTLRIALASGRAVGMEVAIYNPELDRDGSAGRGLTDVLGAALAR